MKKNSAKGRKSRFKECLEKKRNKAEQEKTVQEKRNDKKKKKNRRIDRTVERSYIEIQAEKRRAW